MKSIFLSLLIACCIVVFGCAGARTTIKADGSEYDISLSRAIRDSSGNIIPTNRLEKVGTFQKQAYGWGIFYSAISLNRIDISGDINQQVKAANGNAITKFSVSVNNGFLNYLWVLNWLPFWPGYNVVDFGGDIVKILPERNAGLPEDNERVTK